MGAQWKVINENYKNLEGYKRVAWPPASEERIVREFTPQPQTQYQPAPAYNQQYQPTAAANASTAPPTQDPIYNNIQHNNSNFTCETNSPYKSNSNQNDYEAFPPQTPETPIILKDKQFSRLPSQEPNPINTVPYHQHHQPQNQIMSQQHHQHEEHPYKQPLFSQKHMTQQYEYHSYPNQSVTHAQQQQQQCPILDEHLQHHTSGWKPIRPPQTKQEHLYTGQNGTRETTPFAKHPVFQPQYQQSPTHQQQQYRAPSYDKYQQQQQQQYPQSQASQNPYQQPPQAGAYYPQPSQQPGWVPSEQAARQQPQQQYQQPPWMQQQQQYHPQQQPARYQNSLNQYNQAPYHQQQQQYPLQQNQFLPQTNQQQFNSYSQPQQQQHTVSHDQVDQQQQPQHFPPHLSQDQRGASPGIITLRKEVPITQKPAPVYTSQPAAIKFRESSIDSLGGSSMRGDLKWPPPEYKEAAAKENEERRKLALGPVCRPRKVHRDYTSFFAKNALSHHYPSYKVPPGTQHMIN